MEENQLVEFRNTLEKLLAEMEQPLGKRELIAVENTPDTLDQVQNAADRALALRLLESDSRRLRELKDARARIADGTYGTCLGCDAEINMKRLKAVPWTRYCVQCQEQADHEEIEVVRRESEPPLMARAAS